MLEGSYEVLVSVEAQETALKLADPAQRAEVARIVKELAKDPSADDVVKYCFRGFDGPICIFMGNAGIQVIYEVRNLLVTIIRLGRLGQAPAD